MEKIDPTRRTDPDRRRVRIEQPDLEAILHRHATGLGVEVRREQEVVGVRQDGHAVTVEVRITGGVRELSARYLVGCDGAGSPASTSPAPTRPSPVGWRWSTWWTRGSCGQDSTTRRTACTGTGTGMG